MVHDILEVMGVAVRSIVPSFAVEHDARRIMSVERKQEQTMKKAGIARRKANMFLNAPCEEGENKL